MRKLLAISGLIILFQLSHLASYSQGNDETEITKLENMEGEAWVKKDSVTLFQLFSPNLVVNTPLNRVATMGMLKNLMRAGKIDISYSEKVIEKISFINDMAIVMGHDIVKPQGAMEDSGKPLQDNTQTYG